MVCTCRVVFLISLIKSLFCVTVEIQPMPSYTPGTGLNAIQEDSEMEEKETGSAKGSEASEGHEKKPLPEIPPPPNEPEALSPEDVMILSKSGSIALKNSLRWKKRRKVCDYLTCPVGC